MWENNELQERFEKTQCYFSFFSPWFMDYSKASDPCHTESESCFLHRCWGCTPAPFPVSFKGCAELLFCGGWAICSLQLPRKAWGMWTEWTHWTCHCFRPDTSKEAGKLSQDFCPWFICVCAPLLSSIIEMTIDWKNQRCLKLLIRLKIRWKVIFLTWFVRFSQVCWLSPCAWHLGWTSWPLVWAYRV